MEQEKIKEIKEALKTWQESVMLSIDDNYVSHRVTNSDVLEYIEELEDENGFLEMDNNYLKKQNIELESERDYYQDLCNENDAFYKELEKQKLEEFACWLAKRSNNNVYLRLVKEFEDEFI